jgi:hypothetical protein
MHRQPMIDELLGESKGATGKAANEVPEIKIRALND